MLRERITITIRQDVVSKIDTIIDGQKVRNRSNAIETIVLEHFKHHILNKAVILGGGHGIKLAGKTIPKVLMPLGDKTLLEKNLATLRRFGVSEAVISTGKWTNEVKNAMGHGEDCGVKISYYEEGKSGTAGVLLHAKKKFKETFMMMNGDILLEEIDIEDMYNFHKKHGGLATIGVATARDPSGLGSIFMKGQRVIGFREKPALTEKMSNLVSGGVYFLEPGVCSLAKKAAITMEYDIFPVLAEKDELYGYQLDRDWVHLHDEKAYKKYLNILLSNEINAKIKV